MEEEVVGLSEELGRVQERFLSRDMPALECIATEGASPKMELGPRWRSILQWNIRLKKKYANSADVPSKCTS